MTVSKKLPAQDAPPIIHDLGSPLSNVFAGLNLRILVKLPQAASQAPIIEQFSIMGQRVDTLDTLGKGQDPAHNAALQQFFADKAEGARNRGNYTESWMCHGLAQAPGLNNDPKW